MTFSLRKAGQSTYLQRERTCLQGQVQILKAPKAQSQCQFALDWTKLRGACPLPTMVRAGSATKLADQLTRDLGSNVSFWSLVSRVSICYSGVEVVMPSFIYMGVMPVGLQTAKKRFSSPGLLLCGRQGLLWTLATAGSWAAAVCYRTHMADAARHKSVRLAVGQQQAPTPPKLW